MPFCSFPLFFSFTFFFLPLLLLAGHAKLHTSNDNNNNKMQLPQSEAETLFTIMETMSSDQTWRASYPHPCQTDSSWPGIECKPASNENDKNILHVSRLDFGNPPYPTCKKTATFPSQIFSLPYLQSVFFFNCFTVTNTNLSFSREFLFNSSPSSLHQLSLMSNPALTGPIPPEISHLKSLKILTLSQNRLSGPIPEELFTLTSLVHLDLSYNMLTGSLSDQLGNLNNLVGLDLSYNMLTNSIPSTIGQLGLLQKLDLSSNLLTGGIPNTIGELHSLVFLALSSNKLSGKFPQGLENLESLQYLIMDENPMSMMTLPLGLGKLVRLQELRLADSGYSGTIPESFSQLKNLSTLSLQNNRLTGEIPEGFGGLPHIYHLNLSRNFLGGIVPFNASFLNRLGRNLDLSGNPGLCLSSSEAYGVEIGVNVCGRNKSNGSDDLNQPLMSSSAFSFELFMPIIFSLFFWCLGLASDSVSTVILVCSIMM